MPTPIALVTGANRGIGLATAQALAGRGMTVLLGSRDLARGQDVAAPLQDAGLDVRAIRVDVTDDASVRALARRIDADHGWLDVLVNNAGLLVRRDALQVTAEGMQAEFDTNVFGLVRMVHALIPLLRRSTSPRIVNLSSDSSMFAHTADPGSVFARSHESFVYAATKAAVNMLTLKYANAFAESDGLQHVKINAVTPGYTATDLNDHKGVRTVQEGARAAVIYATIGDDGPSGRLFDDEGELPW